MPDNNEVRVGNDNVVIGDVAPRNMGDGNVFIGATDAHGNTRLGPMVVGRNAQGGPTDTVIGANARGGGMVDPIPFIDRALEVATDPELVTALEELKEEAQSPKPNKSNVDKIRETLSAFSGIKAVADIVTMIGAANGWM